MNRKSSPNPFQWFSGSLALLLIGLAVLASSAAPALAQSGLDEIPTPPEVPLANPQINDPSAGAFELRFTHYYKEPDNVTTDELAKEFNFFILSKGDESFRDELIAQGGRRPILQYIRFEAIHDPGDCTKKPWRNNAAYLPGDFCDISKNHSDWFLLDQNGDRIVDTYQDEDFYVMDPLNPGWQAFFVERVKQSMADTNWAGTFLDNVEVTLSFREKDDEVPAKYPTDAEYLAATQGFLKYMYTNYYKPNGKLLYANIVARKDDAQFPTYLDYLDGAMHEGWSIDNPKRWRPASTWEKQITLAEQSLAKGKFMVLVGQGKEDDNELQRFAYASFLLVTNGKAAFRYGNSSDYRQAWVYDNYHLNLGAPLGPRYKASDTVWRRDYTNGYVTVDPTNHKAEITATTGASLPPQVPPSGSHLLYLPVLVK